MGDRGQIKVGAIYLYTHWGGSELLKDLKNALMRGRGRWTDEEYLTRIIFCEMVKDEPMTLMGYGIGTTEHEDNEHPIPEVDVDKQTITNGINTWTFEKFIEQELTEEAI